MKQSLAEAANEYVGADATPEQLKPGYRAEFEAFKAGAKWATEKAEQILQTWHFTKGGYSEIAKRIADLTETE